MENTVYYQKFATIHSTCYNDYGVNNNNSKGKIRSQIVNRAYFTSARIDVINILIQNLRNTSDGRRNLVFNAALI